MVIKKNNEFDVIVIGSGAAGFSAAEAARSLGASVCIIEGDTWGGECPNYACIPTKTLLQSAKKYHEAKHLLSQYGVHTRGVSYHFADFMERKEHVVDTITTGGKRVKKLSEELGITTIKGVAVFKDSHTVQVASRKISAKNIIIATGAVDAVPPIHGIENIQFLTYKDVVQLKKQPKSVAIIGGGPVGCEFATFFGLIGTSVTVFEAQVHVLPHEDEEIAVIAEKEMKDFGVQIQTSTKVLSVEKVGSKVRLTYQENGRERKSVVVEKVILSAGKRANVDGMHIEATGIEMNERGYMHVSPTLQTSVKHIFVAGDVAGNMQFTHVAHRHGVIAGTNAVKSKSMLKYDDRVIPRVIFVLPEVASVGLTPKEAVKEKKNFSVVKFALGGLARSVTDGHRVGLIKLLVERKTRKILGAHIVSGCAGELIHEVSLAMHAGLTVDDIIDMVHAFPTYSEGIAAAAGSI